MNREINTIGSKANDALISRDVVTLKAELEKFREQAQNVNEEGRMQMKNVSAKRSCFVLHSSLFILHSVQIMTDPKQISAFDSHLRPSGGGKTTLCQQLLSARPDMTRAITCTTRALRPGEKNGVDYYFFEPPEFQRRGQAGEFIEHATVFGHSYGILRSELLDKLRCGRDVLLNVDVQGAATIRDRALADPELKRALVTVFLTPPSIAVLEERLKKRLRTRRKKSKSGWASPGRKSRSGKF